MVNECLLSLLLLPLLTVLADPGVKRRVIQPLGELCVKNEECEHGCCYHVHSIAGKCVERAPVGEVCGFVAEDELGAETYYRVCEACDTKCCCGKSCCPTGFCVTVTEMSPQVCQRCPSGCCCHPNPSQDEPIPGLNKDHCCPIIFCATSEGLSTVQGQVCLKCSSGCCCGEGEDMKCCLTTFCKGSIVGESCNRCLSGCCCGNLCCAYSFCDKNVVSLTKLLSLYSGLSPDQLMRPTPLMLNQGRLGTVLDPSVNYFNYFGQPMTFKTKGWPCYGCSSLCCCSDTAASYGSSGTCCSNAYCTQTSKVQWLPTRNRNG